MDSNTNVALLNSLTQNLTLYCPIIIITIGTIGCLFNFLTFTSNKLRKTSCSIYFFAATVFDLLTLDYGMLTKLLADHFGYTLYQQSQIYCKIRSYLVNVLPALGTCFIVLAALDQYLSTSSKVTYRSYATIKYAKWIALFSFIICISSYIHYMIFADLRPSCNLPSTDAYSVFVVAYSIVWTSVLPDFLMLCFGFGTYWHIRTTRRRVIPINQQQRRLQRTENQLVKMMLFQVGISSLLILTRIVYFSYNIITNGTQRNDYQQALNTFFSQLTTLLFYLNYAKSFYIYTLSSRYFRGVFIERIRQIYYLIFPNRINNQNEQQRNLNRIRKNGEQTQRITPI